MSAEHSIVALCAALEVTPAGYHAWQRAAPTAREQTDAAEVGTDNVKAN